jgi:hypothetical protein
MARCGLRKVQGASGLCDVLPLGYRHVDAKLLQRHLLSLASMNGMRARRRGETIYVFDRTKRLNILEGLIV